VTQGFNIVVAAQTITFGALSAQPYGAAPFTVNATASSGLPVKFTAGAPSVCTVALNVVTLTGVGSCSIVANQSGNSNYSPAPDVAVVFAVVPVADLTVSVSHAGNFGQGQVGAAFVVTVQNVGGAPSAGTVTVVNTLAAAATATAIGGPGWSCNLSALTCTRSDALVVGVSYPITLTMTVSSTAPASLTNTASVRGGGEINAANDSSSDVAAVTPVRTISVVPASGSGASQSFTFSVGDTAGYQKLAKMMILITSTASQAHACMVMYDLATNTVSLADDVGTSFPYVMNLSGAASIQNSQCTLSATGAAGNGSGGTVTLTLPILFHQSFAGPEAKSILLYAQDLSGAAAGWDVRGSWSVPSGIQATGGQTIPETVSVSPSAGSGSFQVFTFTVEDSGGYQNLFGMMVLITSTGTAKDACMIMYDSGANRVELADESGSSFPYALALPSSGTIQNDQCALFGTGISVSGSGSTLALTVPITFSSSFVGTKSVMLYTREFSGVAAGWDARGTWVVPSH
jgi:hypothetical protein